MDKLESNLQNSRVVLVIDEVASLGAVHVFHLIAQLVHVAHEQTTSVALVSVAEILCCELLLKSLNLNGWSIYKKNKH